MNPEQQPTNNAAAEFIAEVAAAPEAQVGDFVTPTFLQQRPLSYSSIKQFKKSPLHYVHYLLAPKETTPAMQLGSLVDCLVLTPEEYENRYVVMPKFDMRTNAGKEGYKQFMEAQEGKARREYITQDMLDQANECKKALLSNPRSAEYLNSVTTAQLKVNWKDKATGLPMTCAIDADGKDDAKDIDFIADLKTAKDASPDEFMRAAYNLGYHIQAATYLEACRRKLYRFPKFVFIVVETEPPYGVAVYDKISPAFFKLGLQELNDLRQAFKHCMENKLFHQSYEFLTTDGGLILDLPGYAKQKINA